MVSIARLSVVKRNSFGLPGQYGRRVTKVNCLQIVTRLQPLGLSNELSPFNNFKNAYAVYIRFTQKEGFGKCNPKRIVGSSEQQTSCTSSYH